MTISEIAAYYPLTSPFGARPQFNDFHRGADFATPVGIAIHAHMNCNLVLSGNYAGEVILCLDALDGSHNWIIGHCSEALYKAGTVVKAGTLIGKTGNTGNSTGPHAHIEYATGRFRGSVTANHTAGATIDPLPIIKALQGDTKMFVYARTITPLEVKLPEPIPLYNIETNQPLWDSGLAMTLGAKTNIVNGSTYYIPTDRLESGEPYGFREEDVYAKGNEVKETTADPAQPVDPAIAEKAQKFDQLKTIFRGLMD